MKHFNYKIKNKIQPENGRKLRANVGFTIMEIVVATTIFAVVVSSILSLYNHVLKINRRSEALRQATQGMRSMVEFLVKEVRNGAIDYSSSPLSPCAPPDASGNSYGSADTRLGLVTAEGDRQCVYLAEGDPSETLSADFTGKFLKINKNGSVEKLNPAYFTVEQAKFMVRPISDPYATPDSPKIQPLVSMFFHFQVALPTGEVVPIYYQTSASSGRYDIPTQ